MPGSKEHSHYTITLLLSHVNNKTIKKQQRNGTNIFPFFKSMTEFQLSDYQNILQPRTQALTSAPACYALPLQRPWYRLVTCFPESGKWQRKIVRVVRWEVADRSENCRTIKTGKADKFSNKFSVNVTWNDSVTVGAGLACCFNHFIEDKALLDVARGFVATDVPRLYGLFPIFLFHKTCQNMLTLGMMLNEICLSTYYLSYTVLRTVCLNCLTVCLLRLAVRHYVNTLCCFKNQG